MTTSLGAGGVFYLDTSLYTTAYRIIKKDIINYKVTDVVGEATHIELQVKRVPHYEYNGNSIALWTPSATTMDMIFISHDPAQDSDMLPAEDSGAGYSGVSVGIIRSITDNGLYLQIDAYSYLYDIQGATVSRTIPATTTIKDAMGLIYDSQSNPAHQSITISTFTTYSQTGFTNPNNLKVSDGSYATCQSPYSSVMLRLLKNSVQVGNEKIFYPNTVPTMQYFGSDGDMWGTTLTSTDVKASGFGVRIRVSNDTSNYAATVFDFSSLPSNSAITGIKVGLYVYCNWPTTPQTDYFDYVTITVYYMLTSQKDGTSDPSNTLNGDCTFKNIGGQKAIRRLQRKLESSNTKPLFFKEVNWTNIINFRQWDSTSEFAIISNASKQILTKPEWANKNEDLCNSCNVRNADGGSNTYENTTSISTYGKKTKILSMPELISDTDAIAIATSLVNLLKDGRTTCKLTALSSAIFPSATLYKDAGVGRFYRIIDNVQNTTKTLGLRKITFDYPGKSVDCEFDTVPFPLDYFQIEMNDNTGSLISNTQGFQFTNVPSRGTLIISNGGDTAIQISPGTTGQILSSDPSVPGGVTWITPTTQGEVTSPVGTYTVHGIAKYQDATGDIIETSSVTIDDSQNLGGAVNVTFSGNFIMGSTTVITSARVLQNITGNITMFDSGTLTVSRGGTGAATWVQGNIPYSSSGTTTALTAITNPTAISTYLYCTNATAGTIAYAWSATWQGNTITLAKGGTNKTSYTQGQIVWAEDNPATTLGGMSVPTVQFSLLKCITATAGSIAYGWSGLTIDASDNIGSVGNIVPSADGTKNLGSASASWANIYLGTNLYLGTAEDAYIYRSGASVVSTGSDDGLAIAGTQILTSARVLSNITGNITMFDTGTLTVARGGTNSSSFVQGQLAYASVATTVSGLTNPTATSTYLYCSNATAGSIAYTWSADWQGNKLTVAKGGTNTTSFTQGAIIYASATTDLTGISAPTLNYFLKCTNATAGSVAYGWGAVLIDPYLGNLRLEGTQAFDTALDVAYIKLGSSTVYAGAGAIYQYSHTGADLFLYVSKTSGGGHFGTNTLDCVRILNDTGQTELLNTTVVYADLVTQAVYPSANATYNLGSITYSYGIVYARDLRSTGLLQIMSGGGLGLSITSASGDITCDDNLTVGIDSTISLGTSGYHWSSAYVDNIRGDAAVAFQTDAGAAQSMSALNGNFSGYVYLSSATPQVIRVNNTLSIKDSAGTGYASLSCLAITTNTSGDSFYGTVSVGGNLNVKVDNTNWLGNATSDAVPDIGWARLVLGTTAANAKITAGGLVTFRNRADTTYQGIDCLSITVGGTEIVTSSRALQNIGTIGCGAITSTGKLLTGDTLDHGDTTHRIGMIWMNDSGGAIRVENYAQIQMRTTTGASGLKVGWLHACSSYADLAPTAGYIKALNGFQIGTSASTTVIDSSGNYLTPASGTVTAETFRALTDKGSYLGDSTHRFRRIYLGYTSNNPVIHSDEVIYFRDIAGTASQTIDALSISVGGVSMISSIGTWVGNTIGGGVGGTGISSNFVIGAFFYGNTTTTMSQPSAPTTVGQVPCVTGTGPITWGYTTPLADPYAGNPRFEGTLGFDASAEDAYIKLGSATKYGGIWSEYQTVDKSYLSLYAVDTGSTGKAGSGFRDFLSFSHDISENPVLYTDVHHLQTQHLYPAGTQSYTLGSSTLEWNTLYIYNGTESNIRVSGGLFVRNYAGTGLLDINCQMVKTSGGVFPITTNNMDLGGPDVGGYYPFRALHLGDGSAKAQLIVNGTLKINNFALAYQTVAMGALQVGTTPATVIDASRVLQGVTTDTNILTKVNTASLVSGDIFYVDATPRIARLPKSTDGLYLKLVSGLPSWQAGGGGTGDVVGPASATIQAIAIYSSTTGKEIKNSVVTIADTTGNTTGIGTLGCGAITSTGIIQGTSYKAGATNTVIDTSGNYLTPASGTVTAETFVALTHKGSYVGNSTHAFRKLYMGYTSNNPIIISDEIIKVVTITNEATYQTMDMLALNIGGSACVDSSRVWQGTAITLAKGGTNTTSFTQGAIVYASSTTALTGISAPTLNYYLKCTNATAGSVAYGWSAVSGTGDVVGPGGATDHAICRFDTATGKLIQNSTTTLDDSGNILGPASSSATFDTFLSLVDQGGYVGNATHRMRRLFMGYSGNYPTIQSDTMIKIMNIADNAHQSLNMLSLVISGTPVIDSSRNITNAINITSAGEVNNSFFEFIDDFVYSATIPQPWVLTTGTGGSVTYCSGGGGIFTIVTGTTISAATYIMGLTNATGSVIVNNATSTIVEMRVKCSNTGTAYIMQFGLQDNGGTNQIMVSSNGATYWVMVNNKAGTSTTVTSSTARDSNWHVWRFVVNTTTSPYINVYLDGASIMTQTSTTYVPVAGMGLRFYAHQTSGTSANLLIDYVKVWMPGGSRSTA